MKTVIKYKKKRLYLNLFIGIAWGLLFVVGLVMNYENIEWYYYFHSLLSVIYLGQFFYEKHFQYLIIENNTITKPSLFDSKTIHISDINQVKKFAGDIIIYTNDTRLNIAKNVIDPESYEVLEQILASYSSEKEITV